MQITAISDLHGHFPQNLPGGDILILAGDYAMNNYIKNWVEFFKWLRNQKYEWKVYIAGNHDNYLRECLSNKERDALGFTHEELEIDDPNLVYLKDSGIEIEGVTIYGSPWTPLFDGVNPKYTAYMIPEYELYDKFVQVPDGLDILVTHGPPWGILDQSVTARTINCGSRALLKAVQDAKPRYHIFGHIHQRGNMTYKSSNTEFMNVSHCDKFYRPRKEIRSFEI